MADPNIAVAADDLRFEDRSGCLVLVDPVRPEGLRDVASAWPEDGGRWRWRMIDGAATGRPYSRGFSRLDAVAGMLRDYATSNEGIAARLRDQEPRMSFGRPQIMRVAG